MLIKTEYVITGFEDFKQAIVYEDYIDENGKIKYGLSKKKLQPYFYVLDDAFIPEDRCIVNVESGYVGICGEKLKRIYTRLPTDVSYIRNSFGKTYEADILYPWRARIDNGYVVKDNVRLFLDIEVSMGSRFDKSSFRYPIICVSVYDTKSKEYVVFVWRGDLDRADLVEKRLERIKRGKDENHREMSYRIHTFSSEKDMLLAMCKYIVAVNPDVMTAWNTSFDYPYIINRMHALQMNPGMLSPINFVGIDKFDGEAIVKGRYILDLLQAYKKIHIGQLESFKLDDVGLFEFEVPKIKIDGSFEELWKRDINALVEYNVADLELCVRLDEKNKIMDFFEGISNFTGAPLDECLANSRILDFYLLREAFKRNIRLPSANKDNPLPNFEGAIVKEPIKGLHKNVVCLDLKSLYPCVIMAGNMSLETIDNDGDIKFGNGVSFRSSPQGFIPSMIQGFLDRRSLIKKEMLDEFERNGKSDKYKYLDNSQNVTKFITNSLYGILSFSKSRYYLEDIGKTITYVGREINLFTQKVVEEEGFVVITGDTDSVYVRLPEDFTLDQCIKKGYELQDILNRKYIEFAARFNIQNMTFEVKFEKVFSKMIACKKKRYIGELKWKEGKVYDEAKYGQLLDIVGFETRRSDTSMFTKSFLKEFYKLLIDETPKWDVYKFVRSKMDEYKLASMDEIAQPKSYTKKFGEYQGSSANSVFIKSAEWSNLNLGYDFGEGSKCLFFYTKSTPTGGVCYMRGDSDKLVKIGIKVNWDKMIERGILMKLETIFEALGYDSVDLLSGSEQRKLFEFTEEGE